MGWGFRCRGYMGREVAGEREVRGILRVPGYGLWLNAKLLLIV